MGSEQLALVLATGVWVVEVLGVVPRAVLVLVVLAQGVPVLEVLEQGKWLVEVLPLIPTIHRYPPVRGYDESEPSDCQHSQ